MERQLGIVYVTYREKKLVENIKSIVNEFRAFFNEKIFIVVIENNSEYEYTNSDLAEIEIENVKLDFLLGANGIYREFLMYDLGLQYLENSIKLKKDDLVFITNNTFISSDIKKEIINKIKLNLDIKENKLLGHLDVYPKPPFLGRKLLESWIRSNSIFGTLSTFLKAGSFCPSNLLINEILDLRVNSKDLLKNKSKNHDLLYKKYLETWLLNKYELDDFKQRKESIYKELYKSKANYIQVSWAIICEQLWSQKIKEKNIEIINTSN